MKHFVVAIGREFGAQGCDIAEKLAEKLGVKLYDRQLVEEAAKKLEMDEHTVQNADEVSAKDIEYSFCNDSERRGVRWRDD